MSILVGLNTHPPAPSQWIRWYHLLCVRLVYFVWWESNTKITMLTMDGNFTRGQFWPAGIVVAYVCVRVYVCRTRVCSRNISSCVQLRSPHFRPEVQTTWLRFVPIVSCGVEVGVGWPWNDLKLNLKVEFYIILSLFVRKAPTLWVRVSPN